MIFIDLADESIRHGIASFDSRLFVTAFLRRGTAFLRRC